MRVLVACEFSGVVRNAFMAMGHDAWSCDLLPSEILGQHFCGNVRKVLFKGWDKLGPSDDRAMERSRTYHGIALAMAQQWSLAISLTKSA